MGVSRSGYYDWRNRAPSEHTKEDQKLLSRIQYHFGRSHGIYGSPRILKDLQEENIAVARKRVARIMRENHLVARCVNAFKRTTIKDSALPYADNILGQDFSASEPNRRWVSDITYLRTEEGWLYLAVVMDLYSRAIVGWAMDRHMDASLISAALEMALKARSIDSELLLHSDRGSQYCSRGYQSALEKRGIRCV